MGKYNKKVEQNKNTHTLDIRKLDQQKLNYLNDVIRNNIASYMDIDRYEFYVFASVEAIGELLVSRGGTHVEARAKNYGYLGDYWYLDAGSNVLGVAHLDTVRTFGAEGKVSLSQPYLYRATKPNTKLPKRIPDEFLYKDHVHELVTLSHDDRLGVYILMEVLPSLGIHLDILLTDEEEIGRSTAQYFQTSKKYNWVVEFDRAKNDTVMYDYYGGDAVDWANEHGLNVQRGGSFTDICYLPIEEWGCVAYNIAVEYDNAHSERCYIDLMRWQKRMEQFVSFYNEYKDTFIKLTPEPMPKYGRYSTYSSSSYRDWYDKYYQAYGGYGFVTGSSVSDNPVNNVNHYGCCPLCGMEFIGYDEEEKTIAEYGKCSYCIQYEQKYYGRDSFDSDTDVDTLKKYGDGFCSVCDTPLTTSNTSTDSKMCTSCKTIIKDMEDNDDYAW